MKDNIKVSVVIPVYNVEKYLGRCLDSLLSQSLKEIEIIAVDDVSTDRSYTILKQYENENPEKIRVFQLVEKGRQGTARNLGIEESRGEYIGFVDSDDYVAPDRYKILYNMAKDLKVDMVYGGFVEDYGDYKKIIPLASKLGEENCRIEISKNNKADFIFDMKSVVAGIYTSKLLKENNIRFPERLTYEDNYFVPVVNYFIKSFAYTNKPLYWYNKYNTGSTNNTRNSRHHLDRIKTADMTLKFFKGMDDYQQIKEVVEYIYLEHFYIHTVSCIICHYDKVNYKMIKKVRNKFMKEFPKYKNNCYYIQKFGKIRRLVFWTNEWSPHLYTYIYKLFRKFDGKRIK